MTNKIRLQPYQQELINWLSARYGKSNSVSVPKGMGKAGSHKANMRAFWSSKPQVVDVLPRRNMLYCHVQAALQSW